jgi:N-acyl-phosphatidylethanolamine-hydrolysing phospholipase D
VDILFQELNQTLPVSDLNISEVQEPPTDDRLRVTWLGHASVLVQMAGLSILTDPVFTDRCGPAGLRHLPGVPRRYTRCPCTVQQLPVIDAVVISHSHYDHLDHRLNFCQVNFMWVQFEKLNLSKLD